MHTEIEVSEPKPEFRIDTEDAANWYLRKLANIESEKQRVSQQAAQIVKQLEADAEGLRYKYEGELAEYVRRELAARGSRRKTLPLLQGTCAFRSVPAGLRITDTAAALVHAIAIVADAMKRTLSLDTEKYRELADAAIKNGELLPGVESVPEKESFSVRFGNKD